MRTFLNTRRSPRETDVLGQAKQRTFTNSTAHSKRITILVPEMAESISEGTLTVFQRKINEHVGANDEIATIETDKIDVTIEAPGSGHIVEFLAAEVDTVVVGQKVAIIETELAEECLSHEGQRASVEVQNEQQKHQHQETPQTTIKEIMPTYRLITIANSNINNHFALRIRRAILPRPRPPHQ